VSRFLETDEKGQFLCSASVMCVVEPWRSGLNVVCSEVISALGDRVQSIHVRGSVACGEARVGWSDIDMICITSSALTARDLDPLIYRLGHLDDVLAFASRVDCQVVPLSWLCEDESAVPVAFALATQSVLWHGVPPEGIRNTFSLSEYPRIHLARLNDAIGALAHARVHGDARSEVWLKTVRWAAKRTIRAAGDLVVCRRAGVSRDLATCVESAVTWYPQLSEGLTAALQVVSNPESLRDMGASIESCAHRIGEIWQRAEWRKAESDACTG
jgi:predicted nucleotidyltransferase